MFELEHYYELDEFVLEMIFEKIKKYRAGDTNIDLSDEETKTLLFMYHIARLYPKLYRETVSLRDLVYLYYSKK